MRAYAEPLQRLHSCDHILIEDEDPERIEVVKEFSAEILDGPGDIGTERSGDMGVRRKMLANGMVSDSE